MATGGGADGAFKAAARCSGGGDGSRRMMPDSDAASRPGSLVEAVGDADAARAPGGMGSAMRGVYGDGRAAKAEGARAEGGGGSGSGRVPFSQSAAAGRAWYTRPAAAGKGGAAATRASPSGCARGKGRGRVTACDRAVSSWVRARVRVCGAAGVATAERSV